jgi:hypothetical protein
LENHKDVPDGQGFGHVIRVVTCVSVNDHQIGVWFPTGVENFSFSYGLEADSLHPSVTINTNLIINSSINFKNIKTSELEQNTVKQHHVINIPDDGSVRPRHVNK